MGRSGGRRSRQRRERRGGRLMPIQIDFLSNTSKLERGTENVERGLDGVADSLDDVAREGDRSLGRLERSFKDVSDAAKDTSKQTADVGDVGSRGFRKLGDAGSEVSGELRQNLGETFSSFRGDLADLPQIAQDTLGGLAGAGALGGIAGLAATAAGAAGLGLITAELQKQQEEAQKLRERIGGMYQAAAEDGRAYLDTAQLIAESVDVMYNTDRADEWKRVREDAKTLALDESVVIAANAGDLAAQEQVHGRINALMEDAADKRSAAWNGSEASTYGQALLGVRDRWAEIGAVTDENADKARNAQSITDRYLRQMIDDAGEAEVQVDSLGNKLITLPKGQQIVIDAETNQAHQDLDRFKGDVNTVPREVVTTARVLADTTGITRAIDNLNGRTIYVKVNAQGQREGRPFE
ncbi:hypothetical protein [Microbacterium allomyrinae]|uniref:Uncharacterized protein n=1 Tax=Microbacterium allomyrinae TaxID=2830666 RepID=A0A9X1LY02_9MICO|nr:hypothetical protein [Microbacterium allomyrinae]MCC2034117.1 hypothetical protein [Microbacterium allomyrinae]